ncbi:TetR/AcrR family transcriptional regulator [Paenibacillus sp. S150]|uniref:TetR/AcrR family transcriptional regulator n=1 Tax=Paenibacillus sp. S150 TaxID=2749826 RepID=UPI001C57FEBE|nr:TetR/AcrR family transcriptional regulator [Paenibacillus sp. S150]MBW4083344.1 TetR/AcrR family transcriptional regulator [Paenibacillus sp. S150]
MNPREPGGKQAAKADKKPVQSPSRDYQDPYVQRILAAAQELFDENGLEAVSMYGIARQAGIGQGSLYRRFTDKGEICAALLSASSERFLARLEQDLRDSAGSPSALGELRESIEQVVDFIDQHAELLQMIKSEFTGKKQLTQFEHPIFLRLNAVMCERLRRVAEGGKLIAIDPQFAATALIAVLSPDLYLYQQKVHSSTKREISQGVLALFVAGLQRT